MIHSKTKFQKLNRNTSYFCNIKMENDHFQLKDHKISANHCQMLHVPANHLADMTSIELKISLNGTDV